jgi:hypothetical protein
MTKLKSNQELRNYIKCLDLYLWEVAEQMNVHENTLSRLLRKELSYDNQRVVYQAINQLIKKKGIIYETEQSKGSS